MRLFFLLPLVAALTAPLATLAVEHRHGDAMPHKIELNAGKKWETDAPLRKGMSAIRAAVATAIADAHGGKGAPAMYDASAKEVGARVADIVKTCKLTPKADAQLHIVVGEIMDGVEAMEGKQAGKQRVAGLVAVAKAANTYGEHFAHPGWKPLDLSH